MKIIFAAILLGFSFTSFPSWGADFATGKSAYYIGDFGTAIREWTPLAEQGLAEAQCRLGMIYDFGQGVPQDSKTAVKWYTLAVEQGDAGSQYNLSLMYAKGRGILQDYIYAHMW